MYVYITLSCTLPYLLRQGLPEPRLTGQPAGVTQRPGLCLTSLERQACLTAAAFLHGAWGALSQLGHSPAFALGVSTFLGPL